MNFKSNNDEYTIKILQLEQLVVLIEESGRVWLQVAVIFQFIFTHDMHEP